MKLQIGCIIVKFVVIATIVINTYSFAQSCVFDGKAMKSLGVSEVVNKETLSLFRCSDGHQMWLTYEDFIPLKQEPIVEDNSEKELELSLSSENDDLKKIVSENSDVVSLNVGFNDKNDKIVMTEKVMKRESFGSNLSNSLSIEKFGLETLLFKKLESDRKFAEQLEAEKSELLHMMYTQKKLFDRANGKRFNMFSKAKIFYIYLPVVIAYYIAT